MDIAYLGKDRGLFKWVSMDVFLSAAHQAGAATPRRWPREGPFRLVVFFYKRQTAAVAERAEPKLDNDFLASVPDMPYFAAFQRVKDANGSEQDSPERDANHRQPSRHISGGFAVQKVRKYETDTGKPSAKREYAKPHINGLIHN